MGPILCSVNYSKFLFEKLTIAHKNNKIDRTNSLFIQRSIKHISEFSKIDDEILNIADENFTDFI